MSAKVEAGLGAHDGAHVAESRRRRAERHWIDPIVELLNSRGRRAQVAIEAGTATNGNAAGAKLAQSLDGSTHAEPHSAPNGRDRPVECRIEGSRDAVRCQSQSPSTLHVVSMPQPHANGLYLAGVRHDRCSSDA